MPSVTGALYTVGDYEQAVREFAPAAKRVKIRCAATEPGFPPGTIHVIARRRFLRKLSKADERELHRALVERIPIGTTLELK